MLRRLFRPETAFFIAIWFILLLVFRDRGFYDPGSLWHIQVGELILTQGLPHTDPFTFTFEGYSWVPQQWGAEILMALAHRLGGLDTMLLAFVTGVTGLFTLIFRRATQSGIGPMLAGLLVGGSLFIGAFHYFVRPHMFTIGFLAWTMICIIDFERGRSGLARFAALIPLFVLWTNLHGGVLGGIMTFGLALAGWLSISAISKQWVSPVSSRRTALGLIGIVLASALTPFVNPFGIEMLEIWSRIVNSKVLPRVVNEHMPLDPNSPLGQMVILAGAFYLLALVGTFKKDDLSGWRFPRVSWLLPLVWLVLSFKGIRQAPLFAITAIVALVDLWPETIWHALLKRHGDGSLARDPEAEPRPLIEFAPFAIPAILVGLAFVLQVNRVELPIVGSGWAKLDPNFIPSDLTAEMQQYAALVPEGTRIFNDANFGGYLIYHTPRLKIFMDDRCELYGDDEIAYYSDTLGLTPDKLGPRFEEWARIYQFRRAIVMIDPAGQERYGLEEYLSQSSLWQEVTRGKRAVIFDRRQ